MGRRKKSLPLGIFMGVMAAVVAWGSVPVQAARGRDWRAGQLVRLTGRVQQVDRRDSSFRLDSDGDRIDVEVSASASFTDRNGQRDRRNPYGLEDLRTGERVSVEGVALDGNSLQGKQIRRLEITSRVDTGRDNPGRDPLPDRPGQWGRDMRTRDGLVGTVIASTGGGNRTLRVDVAGREYTIDVPKDTTVRRDGRGLSVHELNEGDRVRVRGDWRDRDRLQARVVEATSRDRRDDRNGNRNGNRNGDNRFFFGTVERLNRSDRSFRLRTDSGTYEVDGDRADFLGNRRFSDIREGDTLRVYAVRAEGRSLRADRIEWTTDRSGRGGPSDDRGRNATLGGTIDNIDFLHRVFRLQGDPASLDVHVPVSVEIRDRDGGRIDFRDLEEGAHVRVIGVRNSSNGMLVASRVEVVGD